MLRAVSAWTLRGLTSRSQLVGGRVLAGHCFDGGFGGLPALRRPTCWLSTQTNKDEGDKASGGQTAVWWRRLLDTLPPRPSLDQSAATAAGVFFGIWSVAALHHFELMPAESSALLVGSFGATAALIFAAPAAPLSQPVAVIGGHATSALMGVAAYQLLGAQLFFVSAPLAVASSVFLMQNLRCFHPPGAATALIAVLGPPHIHALGWSFVVTPAATVPALLVLSGWFYHRHFTKKPYPVSL